MSDLSNKTDRSDKMDATYYLDEDDFRVEIGTVVSFREEFDDPDMPGKTYVIRRMPNLGDTLILSECLIDDNGAVTDILRESTIEVEPWKIGAI
jgi:hypothetical protein